MRKLWIALAALVTLNLTGMEPIILAEVCHD